MSKRWLTIGLFLVVAMTVVEAAGAARYTVYNLPRGAGWDMPKDGTEFLQMCWKAWGGKAPSLRSDVGSIESGMPEQFRNDLHGACAKGGEVKLCGYVEVYFYCNPPQQAGGLKQFCAFTIDYRQLPWLLALVSANKKCEDQKFDDNARRLVMAFASKIGNYNHKGYVKPAEIETALNLFIAEIKTRGAERMEREDAVTAFESDVEKKLTILAGKWVGNDDGSAIAKKALALLPSSLGN